MLIALLASTVKMTPIIAVIKVTIIVYIWTPPLRVVA